MTSRLGDNFTKGLLFALFVLLTAARSISVVSLQAGDSAHCAGDVLVQTGTLDADCVSFTPTPTLTLAATSTATETSTPTSTATSTDTPTATRTFLPTVTSTWTPFPTDTLTPTPTHTATATNTPSFVLPYASAPLCTSDNLITWHGLWDYARGCHYAYEQGDDPHLGDAVFGAPAAAWGGQTISWPWVSSNAENLPTGLGKHNGYKWGVNVPGHNPLPACNPFTLTNDIDPTGGNSNCITASRIEVHILSSMDDYARYHSSYVEFQICQRPAFVSCGIFRMGSGLTDFAQLQTPHYSTFYPRPGGVVDFGLGITLTTVADTSDLPARSVEPYVFEIPMTELAYYQSHPPTYTAQGFNRFPGTMGQWATNDFDCEPKPSTDPCHNLYYGFLYQVSNSWTLIDTTNINHPVFICRDGSCGYNGSAHGIEEVRARVLAAWDTDGDGFVDKSGYTDRFGNLDAACTAVNFSCIPYSLTHVPVGVAANRHDQGCECSHELHYDSMFSGVQSNWIAFPNVAALGWLNELDSLFN